MCIDLVLRKETTYACLSENFLSAEPSFEVYVSRHTINFEDQERNRSIVFSWKDTIPAIMEQIPHIIFPVNLSYEIRMTPLNASIPENGPEECGRKTYYHIQHVSDSLFMKVVYTTETTYRLAIFPETHSS